MRAGLKHTPKLLALVIFLVLFSLSVLAQQPFNQIQVSTVNGLQIIYPKFEVYNRSEVVILHFHVFNSTGFMKTNSTINCTFHLFDQTGEHIIDTNNTQFDVTTNDFFQNLSNNWSIGKYAYLFHCNNANEGGFVSDSFEITESGEAGQEVSGFPLAVIILLPMFLVIVLLVGAVSLDDEEHPALKIFLFLLSIVPFFGSMHLGVTAITKYYGFTEMQEAMASNIYWVSLMFGVLIIYFLIYLLYTAINRAAQRREEKLKY